MVKAFFLDIYGTIVHEDGEEDNINNNENGKSRKYI